MKKIFFFLFFTTIITAQWQSTTAVDTSLILSEIMFNAPSGNNEFIEIFNKSYTDTINVAGYKFKYYTSNPDVITDAGFGTLLPPRSYAVVFEGDYDFATGIYSGIIPSSALILKISDNAFGTSGMANTTDRDVSLLRPNNDTLSTYMYSANNGTAISDEKKIMSNDNSSSNWANSLVTNGTPGFKNSVTPTDFDLSITDFSYSPPVIIHGDTYTLSARVKNLGIQTASSFTINFYFDSNEDSIGTIDELVFTQQGINLNPGDSVTYSAQFSQTIPGVYKYIAIIEYTPDENLTNNKKFLNVPIYTPGNSYNDVVINEIMYAPLTGEPEWVELYNRTTSPINIKKWTFSDNSTNVTITSFDIIINPGNYIVLSKDSTILNFYSVPVQIVTFNLPALNNTGDGVVIKDSLGIVIDSVQYLPSWGGSTGGKSLERVSTEIASNLPSNWKTSSASTKATPGRKNSVTPKDYDLSVQKFYSSPSFGELNEQITLYAIIKNLGLQNSLPVTVEFYFDANNDGVPNPSELFSTSSVSSISAGDSIEFSGVNNISSLGINKFFVIVSSPNDEDTTNNSSSLNVLGVEINEVRNDIVINEIMYAPLTSQPEWFEIFNRSNKTISLKNYYAADAVDTVLVTSSSIEIVPGEFIVIAKDSSILNFFNITSKLIIMNLPVLNNTGDKLILMDSIYRVIDSVEYLPNWGGSNGRSLERISPDGLSNSSQNWGSSLHASLATPGFKNSLTQKDYDIKVSSIIFDPRYPILNDNVSISTRIKNNGLFTSQFDLYLYEDTDNDSTPDLLLESISGLTLNSFDSSVYNFSYLITSLQNKRTFIVYAITAQDEDTTNNKLIASVEPGVNPQSVVINEVMYAPQGGEPEWIELFNNTEQSVNIGGWEIWDVITTPAKATIPANTTIEANKFLVITRDSSIFNYHRVIPSQVIRLSIPTLNNDMDGVVLRDNRGATIDSLFYHSSWGGTNGYSLERRNSLANSLDPDNWASSVDIEQSTPGRSNSLTPKTFDLQLSSLIFTPRFPVSGDDVSITAMIKNNGALIAQQYYVNFYFNSFDSETADSLVQTIELFNLGAGDSIFITSTQKFFSIKEKRFAAASIVFTEDEDTLNNYLSSSVEPGFAANSIVISEIMYAPLGNEPEWIEITNVSDSAINLKSWSVSDGVGSTQKVFISSSDYFIEPNKSLVLTRDTSIVNFYPGIQFDYLKTNFGTLANTNDAVMIYDFRNALIDSVAYTSSWGGKNGRSIERISLLGPSNDFTNWATSLSGMKATPGIQNSVDTIPSYPRSALVFNEIMYDPADFNREYVEFFNRSSSPINIGGWRMSDESGNNYRLSDTSLILPENEFMLLLSDSLVLNNYPYLINHPYKVFIGTSSLNLTNTGKSIKLIDLRNNTIDSLFYSPSWHNKNFSITKNRSLERINFNLPSTDGRNWSTSVDAAGGTPGRANSIFTDFTSSGANINIEPNPFSPDNDGFEDFTVINYNLSGAISQIRIRIFDDKGRHVRTLVESLPSGQSGSVIFDGLDDSGNPLRIGMYIVFLEGINENSTVIDQLKKVVVIARKL